MSNISFFDCNPSSTYSGNFISFSEFIHIAKTTQLVNFKVYFDHTTLVYRLTRRGYHTVYIHKHAAMAYGIEEIIMNRGVTTKNGATRLSLTSFSQQPSFVVTSIFNTANTGEDWDAHDWAYDSTPEYNQNPKAFAMDYFAGDRLYNSDTKCKIWVDKYHNLMMLAIEHVAMVMVLDFTVIDAIKLYRPNSHEVYFNFNMLHGLSYISNIPEGYDSTITNELTSVCNLSEKLNVTRRREVPARRLEYNADALNYFGFVNKKDKPKHTTMYGIELECVVTGSRTNVNNTLGIIIPNSQGYMLAKRDGSIPQDRGIEFVTAPATIEAHRIGLKCLELDGVNLGTSNSCGMHVHIDLRAFNNYQHVWRFSKFFSNNLNKVFIDKIVGRLSNSYCRRVDADSLSVNPVNMDRSAGFAAADKYRAVNIRKDTTVEVRAFSASVNRVEIINRLVFLDALIEFTANTPSQRLDYSHFKMFCSRSSKYCNLYHKFIKPLTGEVEALCA